MKTGRPRKPQKLKIVTGTFRKSRETREWTPAPARPTCPRYLNAIARKEFRRLSRELSPILTLLDVGILAGYCASYAAWIEAAEKVETDGAVCSAAGGGSYQSPWVAIRNKSLELMHKFGAELGLSPVARTRVKPGNSEKQEDEFEKFLNNKKKA